MGVYGDGHVLDAVHALAQVGDARTEGPRHVVTGRVGDVHHGGTRLHGCLDDAAEEILVRTAGVLGVELDVVHERAGELHRVHGALNRLVLREMQLVAQMARRNAQAGMDARALGGLERLGCNLDVFVDGTREAAYGALVARDTANLGDTLEVAGAGDGEARLDNIDVHADELPRDDELFLGVHAGAGRLLAIAQGRIEDVDFPGHGSSCSERLSAWVLCRRTCRATRLDREAPRTRHVLQGGTGTRWGASKVLVR